MGYSLWGCKELDTTERLTLSGDCVHSSVDCGNLIISYLRVKSKAKSDFFPPLQPVIHRLPAPLSPG